MDIALHEKPVDLGPGQWVGDIPDQPGLRLKVRSTNYKPYRVAIAGISRRFGKRLKTDAGLVDFQSAIGAPLAEHILIDWEGVTNNGAELPYRSDVAMVILTSDDDHGIGAEFRKAVEWAGDHVAEKLAEATEVLSGN